LIVYDQIFQEFVNQVQLIIAFHPQQYLTNESWVALIGSLFMEQTLSWFVFLFKIRSLILNNFKIFLATFVEAFEKHNKNN